MDPGIIWSLALFGLVSFGSAGFVYLSRPAVLRREFQRVLERQTHVESEVDAVRAAWKRYLAEFEEREQSMDQLSETVERRRRSLRQVEKRLGEKKDPNGGDPAVPGQTVEQQWRQYFRSQGHDV